MLSSLFPHRKFIRLDGGMGSMLQKGGMPVGALPEVYNITESERIIAAQKQFVAVGSDIIYANTFGANRHKMAKSGYSVQELISAGIACARKACAGTDTKVALDIGPIGQLLEPLGTLTFEEAYDIFREEVLAGQDADLIVIETMTDLYETKAALLAAKENSDKPVICTMTFEPNLRTFTGCTVASAAMTLEGLGANAVGVNCSLGPDELFPIVEEMAKWTTLPLVVKPNAGLPDPVTGEYLVDPAEFAQAVVKFAQLGVTVYGGCCGTTPEHIKAAYDLLEEAEIPRRENIEIPAAVCSASEVVLIDQPRIIGERINPTGKKRFKAALQANDMDYILDQAVQQVDAGADLLDVNVGMPGIDEKGMMIRTVKALQSIGGTPLQLDSTIPAVMEAALRVYNGKPIVNSVNGEEASLQNILPLVKKYGAAVVGLTLDENGIPKKAADRFAIAKRILDRATALGIPKRDVYIDCLTLTASAEQDGARETLEALHRVKTELGLKTVLGVSNISFGLPNREAVTRTFLTMALENGLDLPIINPNIASMAEAVRAFRLLRGFDVNCAAFVEAYANMPTATAAATPAAAAKPAAEKAPETLDLPYAMSHGLKNEGAKITAQLLETTDAMEVVNEILIPALDSAGKLFEQGKIFLPQLIQTASVAQAAFEVIKTTLIERNAAPVSRGEIVLATVKGDIHDIGKNIVRVLLENYGYTVLDLGRDVPCQLVADTAKEHGVKLVGLSALMTTTLGAMEETIQLVKQSCPDCKIVVGGAVLTADYAEKIGADFYAKDAMETVAVAKEVVG